MASFFFFFFFGDGFYHKATHPQISASEGEWVAKVEQGPCSG